MQQQQHAKLQLDPGVVPFYCVRVLHTKFVTSFANVGLPHSPSTFTSFVKYVGL